MANRSILLVGPYPPPRGGISIHLQRLARLLRDRGIDHHILDEARTPSPGIDNLRRLSPARYFSLFAAAGVVHIHSSNRYVRLAHTLAARLLGAKVVQTVHGHQDTFLSMCALRLSCLLAHATVAVSSRVAAALPGAARVIPAFLPPGGPDEVIAPAMAAWIDAKRREGRRVVAMNAFRPMKVDGIDLYGIDMLIEAFERADVRAKLAAVVCVADVSQDRPYFEELMQRIAASGLEDHISLQAGEVEFAGVLRHCDVFIRPTTTDGDALSIREALWYGVPAIASDATVRPTGTVTFPTRDLGGFVAALLANADRRRSPDLAQDFSTALINLYSQVLAGSGAREQSRAPAP